MFHLRDFAKFYCRAAFLLPDNYSFDMDEEDFEDLLDRITDEDEQLGSDAIAAFLDAAVNAE